MAVGSYSSNGTNEHALAELWNGVSWAIVKTPKFPETTVDVLSGVSCAGPESCTAVGGFTKASVEAQEQPLAERWDGSTWSIQPTPNPEAENGSSLKGISCTGPDACTAGGNYAYFDIEQSIFAMRWHGTSWAMRTQPNPHGENQNTDNSVSCTSASACTSVGSWVDLASRLRTLADGWNGVKWIHQPSPSPGRRQQLPAGRRVVSQ